MTKPVGQPVQCPVDGVVLVRRIETDGGPLAWCQRSFLLSFLPRGPDGCPLARSPDPIPPAAGWACPLPGDPSGWPRILHID